MGTSRKLEFLFIFVWWEVFLLCCCWRYGNMVVWWRGKWWLAAVEELALTAKNLGAALYFPREMTLALSGRGLTFGGVTVSFFFSNSFAVDVALVITVVIAVAALLSCLFSRPLSSGSVALHCVISVWRWRCWCSMMTMMMIMLALASSLLGIVSNAPQEAIYRSLNVAIGSVGGGAVPCVRMLLISSFSFFYRHFTTVVIWSRLRRGVFISARQWVLVARGRGDRGVPVYRWEYVGASGQIIFAHHSLS